MPTVAIVSLVLLLTTVVVLLVDARRKLAGVRLDLAAERDLNALLLAIEDAEAHTGRHRLVVSE